MCALHTGARRSAPSRCWSPAQRTGRCRQWRRQSAASPGPSARPCMAASSRPATPPPSTTRAQCALQTSSHHFTHGTHVQAALGGLQARSKAGAVLDYCTVCAMHYMIYEYMSAIYHIVTTCMESTHCMLRAALLCRRPSATGPGRPTATSTARRRRRPSPPARSSSSGTCRSTSSAPAGRSTGACRRLWHPPSSVCKEYPRKSN